MRLIIIFLIGLMAPNPGYASKTAAEIDPRIVKEAETGGKSAQFLLGTYYAEGKYFKKNQKKAEQWFQKFAHEDGQRAQDVASFYHLTKKNYPAAKNWYEEAIKNGYAPALVNLGDLYRRGYGMAKNYAKADELYQTALKLGVGDANGPLGEMHFLGLGRAINYTLARKFFLKNPNPYIYAPYLAMIYDDGLGTVRNSEQALKWYKAGLTKGNISTLYKIGKMFRNDAGKDKDAQKKALAWFLLGAGYGDEGSERMVRAMDIRVTRSTALKAVEHAKKIAHELVWDHQIFIYLDKVAAYFRR